MAFKREQPRGWRSFPSTVFQWIPFGRSAFGKTRKLHPANCNTIVFLILAASVLFTTPSTHSATPPKAAYDDRPIKAALSKKELDKVKTWTTSEFEGQASIQNIYLYLDRKGNPSLYAIHTIVNGRDITTHLRIEKLEFVLQVLGPPEHQVAAKLALPWLRKMFPGSFGVLQIRHVYISTYPLLDVSFWAGEQRHTLLIDPELKKVLRAYE